jgi:arylsulfatase A-like enzyme
MDWMPTLCRLAGIADLPELLDGEDVSDIWLGKARDRRTPLFWRTSAPGTAPAMRVGNWKYHLNPKRGGGPALYDLSKDPSESVNVAEQNPEVTARLRKKLNAWVAELPTSYEKADQKKKRERKPRKGKERK